MELNPAVLDIAGALQGRLDGRRTYLPLVAGTGPGEQLPPHTVRWQALIGFGSPSIGQIREYTGLCGADPCPKHDELPVDGDGTVPLFSAALGDPARGRLITDAAQRWYVERGHTALVQRDYLLGVPTGDGPALEWLGARLAEQPGLASQGIQTAPVSGLSGLQIAALGPAALRATDSAGQSVRRAPGAEPAPPTWPGANYDRLPNGEFAFLKSWRDGAAVELGAERAGAVDLKLRLFQHGQLTTTAVYLGLRLGPASRVAFDLAPGDPAAPGGWPELRIDANGDGVFEARQPVTALLGPGESGDTAPPAITLTPPGGDRAGASAPSWRASDTGAGLLRVLTALDGAPARLSSASGALEAPGRHTLRVMAIDRAGNASTREFTWSAP
jgi:hypothetical protein